MKNLSLSINKRKGMKNSMVYIGILTILFSLFALMPKAQIITSVAGNGISGYSGDGDSATTAHLGHTSGVAIDKNGNLYIADENNNRIRKVTPNGIITTVAGNGKKGFGGDGDSATNAELDGPNSVALDASGNLFIADLSNARIRKVSTNGIISTAAGNGIQGYSGDGDSATAAELNNPSGLALDVSGNIFVTDKANNRIRKISTNGIISTVAGNGKNGYGGDGGSAMSAELNYPTGIVVDSVGNLFIADWYNQRIRKVSTNGIIITVAGNGTVGYSGDGMNAVTAQLNYPFGVNIDASGNLLIADEGNNRIRKVNTSGIISTVAGNGIDGFGGDGGSAILAKLNYPTGVVVDSVGNLFIADLLNNRIRKVTYSSLPVVITNYELRVKGAKEVVNSWHTATELSTSHFVVQRSTDGNSFTDIGSVRAKGSGNNSYSYVDASAVNGINYYRIKAIDKYGASTYSQVVSVQLTIDNYQLSIIPNPSTSFANLQISGLKERVTASVNIRSFQGKKVWDKQGVANSSIALPIENLSAGIYLITLTNGTEQKTTRWIKTK